jgi:hypothetical protein
MNIENLSDAKLIAYIDGNTTPEENAEIRKILIENSEFGDYMLAAAASYLAEDKEKIEEMLGEDEASYLAEDEDKKIQPLYPKTGVIAANYIKKKK